MDAYEESAQAAEERERIKKEEKALKRWIKLMNGLRVRRRLQAEYGQSDNVSPHLFLYAPFLTDGIAKRTIV
jgi:xeroderma pigmentosum group C-complementing protein